MLKLYFAPGTCALASLIALEEAGLDYTVETLDFSVQAQRSPDYLAINPKGRVPALQTDRGILTETPAILAYIAQSAPQARLAPLDDPFAFAQLQSFNSYLCSTVHVAHAHGRRGVRWADDPAAIESMKAKMPQNMAETFALIVREYFIGPWVMGEAYSIADPYLFTLGRWLEGDGVDPVRFPRILAHRQHMTERPAVERALRIENA